MFSEFEVSLTGKQKQREITSRYLVPFFFSFNTGPVGFWLPFLSLETVEGGTGKWGRQFLCCYHVKPLIQLIPR